MNHFFNMLRTPTVNIKNLFFSILFSLSSHQPYPIPNEYKTKLPQGPSPLHQSIAYTDLALMKFFETAKKTKWYDNTLFIITADHTQMASSSKSKSKLSKNMVPLLLYHPTKPLGINPKQVSQHTDILPTVINFLGLEDKNTNRFGRSLFSKGDGRAIFYHNQSYYYVSGKMQSFIKCSIRANNYLNTKMIQEN